MCCVYKKYRLSFCMCACSKLPALSLSLPHSYFVCVHVCECVCVHVCECMPVYGYSRYHLSLSVYVCVCAWVTVTTSVSHSLLCLFCVAIKFFRFFLLDTFVFSLFLKWFCFTKLSEYVEDYGHSQTLVC